MSKNVHKLLVGVSVVGMGICLVWLLFASKPPSATLPMPNPNGYDDLAKAGQMVAGSVWNYERMNAKELRELIATNAEALSLVRLDLSRECQVPVQFSKSYGTNHLKDLVGLRKLAQTLVTEGKLAEEEDHFNDAAKSYTDTVRLGIKSARGGLVIDEMIGTAIESLGTDQLQKIVDKLDGKSCLETANALENLDIQRQSWTDVLQRENAWLSRTFPGLGTQVSRLLYHFKRERNFQRAVETIESTQRGQRQLVVQLAARAYELEKSQRPKSLADLVPDYLKAIPQDPFTGTNMVFTP